MEYTVTHTGQTLIIRLWDEQRPREIMLDERVHADPTTGQLTDGWLACDASTLDDGEYFVDDGGTVWTTGRFSDAIGEITR